MLNIRNFSPSSINTLKECPLKFLMSYGLNYYAPTPWASTTLGTAGHHVFELIARAKILARDGKKWEKDDIFGRVYADKYPIDKWKDTLYDYYTQKDNHLDWDGTDKNGVPWKEDYDERIKLGLDDEWSPMKIEPENILETELKVELPIEEEWAQPFTDEYGVEHKHLHLKGFVDLIFRDPDGQLVFRDYKLGRSKVKNWTTGRVKKYEDFMRDVQMCIYYHTVKRVYKEEPIGNLWYIATQPARKYVLPIDDEYVNIVFEEVRQLYETLKTKQQFARKCETDRRSCINLKCPFSTMGMKDFGLEHLEVAHHPMRDSFDSLENGKACVCDTIAYFNKHKIPEQIQETCKKKYDR